MTIGEKVKDKLDRNIWEKSRINFHREYIEELLERDAQDTDWKAVLEDHLIKISQFQHERFIHLIVTVTFALLTMLAFGYVYIFDNICFLLAAILFLVLLIPYIAYYYMLENNTQAMYELYDELVKKTKC